MNDNVSSEEINQGRDESWQALYSLVQSMTKYCEILIAQNQDLLNRLCKQQSLSTAREIDRDGCQEADQGYDRVQVEPHSLHAAPGKRKRRRGRVTKELVQRMLGDRYTGMSGPQIAEKYNLSLATVYKHLGNAQPPVPAKDSKEPSNDPAKLAESSPLFSQWQDEISQKRVILRKPK